MTEQPSHDRKAERFEQIVAYLDGELPADESAQVEQRLASDAEFRKELQGMERAWGALDELPNITVDDSFSRTTMEMVVQAAGENVRQMTMKVPVRRRNRRFAAALLAIGAVLAGLLVGKLVWENPNSALQADLPVIQYLDAYTQFRDVEYLRRLQPIFQAQADGDDVAQNVAQFQLVSSTDTRQEWLGELADEERVSLRAKFNRFQGMSSAEQDRLRSLHAQIAADPDAAQLPQTLLAYHQWLQGLPASKQYELREMDLDERLREVRRSVQRESKKQLLTLSKEELLALYRAVRPKLEEMRDAELRERNDRQRNGNARDSRQPAPFWKNISGRKLRQAVELMQVIREVLPEEKATAFMQARTPPEADAIDGLDARSTLGRRGRRSVGPGVGTVLCRGARRRRSREAAGDAFGPNASSSFAKCTRAVCPCETSSRRLSNLSQVHALVSRATADPADRVPPREFGPPEGGDGPPRRGRGPFGDERPPGPPPEGPPR